MAGMCCFAQPNSTLHLKRIHCFKCCSALPDNRTRTPKFLKLAVTGVTELLRLFSSFDKDRSDRVNFKQEEEISNKGIDDVVTTLKTDYDHAYFVTGIFTSEIYDEDCIFEDPTIRFRGKELYSRNLRLLVPFFEFPSIELQKIEKCDKVMQKICVTLLATGQGHVPTPFLFPAYIIFGRREARTYLKLPWRPFISIDGSTVYELNSELKIINHAESWNVSALEAIAQIFTPSNRN
ncbi:uncharacterized protein LOC123209247 isoform X1 [Mangifera indica]|uniref:uncharacterized protein LOC123209247 isoform X1 n=1 Tax=Mangifera indica TaxID=29780 RepID=UPI001CFB4398|nr:uncharacterized protein LOC123209247 isoform X1 [Mangifera indica]